MKTTREIEAVANEAAKVLGLAVTVHAFEAKASEKLGRQVRVSVWSADSKATWQATVALGRALAAAGTVGKVFKDAASHYETREGAGNGCGGWVNGSRAELRVYPEAV